MINIKKTTLALIVALTAGYGVYTSQQKSELSELALANVEALANGEVEIGPLCIDNWQICHIYGPGDHIDGIKVK